MKTYHHRLRNHFALSSVLFVSLLISWSNLALSNNGEVAYAFPITTPPIIDGNLEDWPANTQAYEIARHFNGDAFTPSDNFSAQFKVAYHPQSKTLYFAVEVIDDIHVLTTQSDEDWLEQDNLILYFDPIHKQGTSAASLAYAIGDKLYANGRTSSWDPRARLPFTNNVRYAMSRKGKVSTYEWQVSLGKDFAINKTYGLDFLLVDKDQNDNALYIWGRGTGKSSSPNLIGDLVLLPANHQIGEVSGKLAGPYKTVSSSRVTRVTLGNTEYPNMFISARVNEEGHYAIKAPYGNYAITNGRPIIGNPWSGIRHLSKQNSVKLQIASNGEHVAPTLTVEAIPMPDLLQKEGLLFTSSNGNAEQFETKLDNAVQQYMDYFKVPGASIAVIKDGKVAYNKVFGYKNLYTKEPVTKDTLFEAASITKAVFAVAVNSLAQKGEIDLDKPLYQYLPFEAIAHDERYKKITARHVLSHQTGFPNWAWMNDDNKIDIKFYPGIKFGYSGEGFEYLGRVMAHITGKSIEKLIMEEVQQPFGFVDKVHFSNNDVVAANVAHGHYGETTASIRTPEQIGVAHSMQTTADTFTQFMLGLMQQKGLNETAYRSMLEPQVEVPIEEDSADLQYPQRYSLGFSLTMSPFGLAYGHGGSNGDFNCTFEIYQDHNMGFVIFTNSDTGTAFHRHMQKFLIYGKDTPSFNVKL